MFSSAQYGGGTVLFSESSIMFQGVESDDPKKWMGRHYYNALRAMDCKPEGNTCSKQCSKIQKEILSELRNFQLSQELLRPARWQSG